MYIKKQGISRRAALRGALGGGLLVSLPLPRLPGMLNTNGTAYAAGGTTPLRLVCWCFGNGVQPPRWVPAKTGQGTAWALSDQLQPLAKHKSYLTVVSGLSVKVTDGSGAVVRGHGGSNLSILSGVPRIGGRFGGTWGGASLDVIVGNDIGKNTPVKSIQVGTTEASDDTAATHRYWSANGPRSPNPPIMDAAAVYNKLFGSFVAPKAGGAPSATPTVDLTAAQKSLLDAVLADGNDLRKRLAQDDAIRLEQHLEGLREVEKRLQGGGGVVAGGGGGMGCQKPEAVEGLKAGKMLDGPGQVLHKTMVQTIALAMACDITRSASIVVSQSSGQPTCMANGSKGWHGASHSPGEPTHQFVLAHMRLYSDLADIFRAIPDGTGNLLDNAVAFTISDCDDGIKHGHADMPFAILGKAGGRLKGDTHVRLAGDNTSKLPFTIARAVGSSITSFGSGAGMANSEIASILA